MTKWSILNERLRNLDPAVLVSHTADIYLLKNQTANIQPLNLLVTTVRKELLRGRTAS